MSTGVSQVCFACSHTQSVLQEGLTPHGEGWRPPAPNKPSVEVHVFRYRIVRQVGRRENKGEQVDSASRLTFSILPWHSTTRRCCWFPNTDLEKPAGTWGKCKQKSLSQINNPGLNGIFTKSCFCNGEVGSGWSINPCIYCISELNMLTRNKQSWPTNTTYPRRCYHSTRGQMAIRAGHT